MLQAPSHLSRVCGHGHIKKFWLMQTQKENQACESRSNRSLSSPTARPANRGTLKGIDKPPWSTFSPLPHSSAFGDAAGTPSKHAISTCAESLSPSSQSCKPSSTLSPSLGSSGAESEKERFNPRLDCLDSFPMAVGGGAHSSMPLPYTRPFNAAAEQASNVSTVPLADVDSQDPSRVYINDSSNKERSSSFTEGSPDSNSSQYSRGIQGLNAHRPLEIGNTQDVKSEDRTSPANHSRELKSFSSHVRFATLMNADDAVSKGKGCGPLVSRMQELDHDFLSHGAYTQHPVPKACSLCGTTKTPMWRSGPHGPKSLCNACGIRFKKYRSFPGAEPSGLMSSPLLGPAAPKPLLRPLKRKQNSLFSSCDSPSSRKVSLQPAVPDVASQQQQKKSKWHQMVFETEQRELTYFNQDRSSSWFTRAGPPSLKKIYGCSPFQSKFKKLAPMDDHLSVNGVFAKDEEEAAVLLMHLSCGLVY